LLVRPVSSRSGVPVAGSQIRTTPRSSPTETPGPRSLPDADERPRHQDSGLAS
jgi:hypothetical protein